MCSGERNPAGGVCNVVNETTSPMPGSVAGVIATGWCGQYVAGGATTMPQRGHFDPAMVSIMIVGASAASTGRDVGGLS
jgi:hypothetical protein